VIAELGVVFSGGNAPDALLLGRSVCWVYALTGKKLRALKASQPETPSSREEKVGICFASADTARGFVFQSGIEA
jgi:hypothetical protein